MAVVGTLPGQARGTRTGKEWGAVGQRREAGPGHRPADLRSCPRCKFLMFSYVSDESPQTCRCLLEEGGLEVVIKVLEVFHDHSIETKVLGLLNNVAEVHDLKSRLLSQSCLDAIGRLLRSSKIDVSYFAAGILAHLCADQEWNISEPTRDDCLSALVRTAVLGGGRCRSAKMKGCTF